MGAFLRVWQEKESAAKSAKGRRGCGESWEEEKRAEARLLHGMIALKEYDTNIYLYGNNNSPGSRGPRVVHRKARISSATR